MPMFLVALAVVASAGSPHGYGADPAENTIGALGVRVRRIVRKPRMLRTEPGGSSIMDPKWLFPMLAAAFASGALWRFATRGWRDVAARTWLLMAAIFAAVSLWLNSSAH